MIWLNGGILFPDKDRGQTSASLCVTLLPDRFPSCVTDIQTYMYFLCHTATDILSHCSRQISFLCHRHPDVYILPVSQTSRRIYTSCHTTTDIQFPMCIMAPDIFLPVSQTSRHTDLIPMPHFYRGGHPLPQVSHCSRYILSCVTNIQTYVHKSCVTLYCTPDIQTVCLRPPDVYLFLSQAPDKQAICVTNIKHVYSTSKRFLNRYSVLSVSNCSRLLHFLCPEEEERYFPYAAQNTVVFPNPDRFTSWMRLLHPDLIRSYRQTFSFCTQIQRSGQQQIQVFGVDTYLVSKRKIS